MALPESRLDGLVKLTRRERALLIVLERARSCVQFWGTADATIDGRPVRLHNLGTAIRGADEAYEALETENAEKDKEIDRLDNEIVRLHKLVIHLRTKHWEEVRAVAMMQGAESLDDTEVRACVNWVAETGRLLKNWQPTP